MSSTLRYGPADPPSDLPAVDTSMKWLLQQRYGYPVRAVVDHGIIPWLEGIVAVCSSAPHEDARLVYDAKNIIKAIKQHKRVLLDETNG